MVTLKWMPQKYIIIQRKRIMSLNTRHHFINDYFTLFFYWTVLNTLDMYLFINWTCIVADDGRLDPTHPYDFSLQPVQWRILSVRVDIIDENTSDNSRFCIVPAAHVKQHTPYVFARIAVLECSVYVYIMRTGATGQLNVEGYLRFFFNSSEPPSLLSTLFFKNPKKLLQEKSFFDWAFNLFYK